MAGMQETLMLNLALKQGVGWPLDDAAAGKILRWTKVWVSKRVNSSCLNIVPPINPPADQTVRSPPARSLLLGVLAWRSGHLGLPHSRSHGEAASQLPMWL